MTIKFLKDHGMPAIPAEQRAYVQRLLDGGTPIIRNGCGLIIGAMVILESPGAAITFRAALNKLRRPLHLLKQDLDADWARRVKERDSQTCVLCGVTGDKIGETIPAHTERDEDSGENVPVKSRTKKDVLTAHHWLKTKARSGMARWARPCGVTVHYAEHIHSLHENPCWVDLEKVYRAVAILEGEEAIKAAIVLAGVPATEERVRAAWLAIPPKKAVEA